MAIKNLRRFALLRSKIHMFITINYNCFALFIFNSQFKMPFGASGR